MPTVTSQRAKFPELLSKKQINNKKAKAAKEAKGQTTLYQFETHVHYGRCTTGHLHRVRICS